MVTIEEKNAIRAALHTLEGVRRHWSAGDAEKRLPTYKVSYPTAVDLVTAVRLACGTEMARRAFHALRDAYEDASKSNVEYAQARLSLARDARAKRESRLVELRAQAEAEVAEARRFALSASLDDRPGVRRWVDAQNDAAMDVERVFARLVRTDRHLPSEADCNEATWAHVASPTPSPLPSWLIAAQIAVV